jgi:hypothetical protein
VLWQVLELMRLTCLVALMGAVLIGCVSGQPASSPLVTPPDSRSPVDDDLKRLAAEFRSLRAIPGQFGGGEWNDAVDRWGGRKHTLMIDLGSRLGAGDFDKDQIVQLLGAPDRVARAGDDLYDLISSLPGRELSPAASTEYLVYYWRGAHDFLFFEYRDSSVAGSDWWYAGE